MSRAARLVLTALLAGDASAALGQDRIETIVVTGERFKRPLSDTVSSVAVISGDEIDRLPGTSRIEDLLAAMANVRLGSGGEGPTIRGQDGNGPLRDLPAFLSGNRPRVTLQIDGRPISYNELAYGVTNLWDVERVEIFRSPQTTTQGRNSIGGAIFAFTRDPTFEWEGRARAVVGDYATRQWSAALSGPVVADALAFRLSGDLRRSRPSSRITSAGAGIDYNRDRSDIVRLKLLATPAALPGLRLTATASHNRSGAPQFEGVRAPFERRQDPEATYGFFDVRVDAVTLQGQWDFARAWSATLTATGGHALSRRHAPAGFGVARIRARDRGLESVVTWRPNAALSLLAGASTSRATLAQAIDLTAAGLGRGDFDDRQDSLGVFGQAEWKPVSRLTLSAGVRYQRDDQDRQGVLGIDSPAAQQLDFDQRFKRLLPKFTASWEVTTGTKAGLLIQRAYNPGGVSLDARRRLVQTFDPETLWDSELFLRVRPPGSAFGASINAFAYDQSNLQRSIQRQIVTPAGIVTIAEIGNVRAGRTRGAEMEATWQASRRLRLAAGMGLLRTRLTRTDTPGDPLLGKEYQIAPHLTASASAEWRPIEALRLSVQGRHHSGYFSDDTNDPGRRVGGATVIDASANWSTGRLSIGAYVRNLTDRFYLTYKSAPSTRLATAGDPREFGVSAETRF